MSTVEDVEAQVWSWLNRHDAPWSPSDAKVRDLAQRIADVVGTGVPPPPVALADLIGTDITYYPDGVSPDPSRVITVMRMSVIGDLDIRVVGQFRTPSKALPSILTVPITDAAAMFEHGFWRPA